MNANYLRGIYLRLAGLLVLVVMLALVANAALSHRTFERVLTPQIAAKVASVGASVRALAFKWAENGVELKELFGVKQRFAEAMADAPEVSYMAITDTSGAILHESAATPKGAAEHFRSAPVLGLLQTTRNAGPLAHVGGLYLVSMPMVMPDRALGTLHLGVNARFLDRLVLDMLYDVGVVLIVTLFFTLELLHFIAGAKLEGSLRVLGDTFERGAAGNFTARPHPPADDAFKSLVSRLDAALEQVNQAYARLAERLDASLRAALPQQTPNSLNGATRSVAQADVQAGLRSLARRFRFGSERGDERADDGNLARVRAPLFMFIMAEELTRSFVPGYVQALLVPIPWLSPQIVVGLPIALFMLIVAIGQPFLGVYCQRHGHRRTMLQGAGIAALGFVATALAHNVLDLLLWRSLCALGYAMVFVASQSFVLDNATPANRARSFAVFVGAIMAASVCGPSIGGILADNIGARPTFGIAALLAAGSMAIIRLLPATPPLGANAKAIRLPKLSEIGALMLNRRFMMVTGLAAMPAKMLLTGVCFYLIPLYVLSIGSTQAMAGRILMTYAVMMVVLSPLTAALANSRQRMHWLVGGGLLISGVGAMLMLVGAGVGWIFAAVTLIGLGQAMSISAQSALVAEHCPAEVGELGEGVVYGIYRLLERIGNALGPLIAAALALSFDYRTGFIAIGSAVALCGVVFLLATWRQPEPSLAVA